VIEHRQEFQRELEAIDAKVTGLFAMVADGLPSATYALLSGNNEVLGALAEREQVIAPCTCGVPEVCLGCELHRWARASRRA